MIRFTTALLSLFWDAIKKWRNDDAPRMAAALAFYTLLSLAPVILFTTVIVNLLFDINIETVLIDRADDAFGTDGMRVVQTILDSGSTRENLIATVVSLIILLISASNMFTQLQRALADIWRIPEEEHQPILIFFWRKLKAIAMVLGLGLLFTLLVLITLITRAFRTFVEALAPFLGTYTPGVSEAQWRRLMSELFPLGDTLISFVLLLILFAWLFKNVPHDDTIQWKDVILGAIVSAALFTVGKYVMGWYFASGSVGAAYGAAGSLLIVLIWFYFSAHIFLLGAEITYVFAHRFGTHKHVTSK